MLENENAIYNQVEAVKNLNKVEGFDPLKFMRIISEEGTDKPKWYLDVKYRILWFRLCNKRGKIATEIKRLTDKMAVVESRIYLDYADDLEKYISKATSQRVQGNVNDSISFLEWAETAAIGRALTNAGYGIQFCDMLEGNDVQPTESGVDIDKIANVTSIIQEGEEEQPALFEALNNEESDKKEPTNFEEAMKKLTINECKEMKVTFGKNSGKTLEQIAIEDPGDINWIVERYSGKDFRLKAAATILFNQALEQVG